MRFSTRNLWTLAAIVFLTATVFGCSTDTTTSESQDADALTVSRGEHDRDEGGSEEGEESGTQFSLNDRYDDVRHGAQLVLAYDAPSNTFKGTIENTTDKVLKRVRVEVHLSNGKELGPTTPTDLEPGQKIDVTLPATEESFDAWSAHPEVGSNEHGHGEHSGERKAEAKGEHSRERKAEAKGEHDREGSGEHKEGGSE